MNLLDIGSCCLFGSIWSMFSYNTNFFVSPWLAFNVFIYSKITIVV